MKPRQVRVKVGSLTRLKQQSKVETGLVYATGPRKCLPTVITTVGHVGRSYGSGAIVGVSDPDFKTEDVFNFSFTSVNRV